MKRRKLLIGMGLASIAAPLSMRSVQAGECKDTSEPMVNLLFVQSAHGAKLSNGVLRLKTVNPATLLFSDRPDRVTGHEPTEDFVDDWGKGDDSFESNPPNATLSILTGPEPQEIVLVLKSPRLDNGDLLYDVKVLDGASEASGDASSLFIDTIGRPLTPVSVAGVHRRHRRRRAHIRH
jgi:hypothetical protein